MSMRKDREITIIRENSSKSSRPTRRLSISLTEALLEDSTDPLLSLYEGTFLNEERVKIPGPDKKFIDQHPEVRELAKGVGLGKTSPVDIDIEGIPLKRIEITNNKNGIPRVYSDPSEAQKWRVDKRTTAAMQEPVIEITPATSGNDPDADAAADDFEQQVDAERAQGRVSPEVEDDEEGADVGSETSGPDKPKTSLSEFDEIAKEDSLSYDQKLDKWLETYNRVLDLSDYGKKDELKSQASEFIEKLKSDKDNVLKSLEDAGSYFHTNLKSITNFLSDDSMIPKSSIMTIVASERDRLESEGGAGGDGAGGDGAGGDGAGGESSGERRTDPAGEPPGGDVVGGEEADATPGAEVETAPPPTPSGDAKALRDYIDNIAAKGLTPDEIQGLSENRRPLHKRSLIDLLYSS